MSRISASAALRSSKGIFFLFSARTAAFSAIKSFGWRALRESRIEAGEIRLKSPGHQRQFIDCVKSRAATLTPAEIAHRSASVGHLCRAAIATGRKLSWDPVAERIVGDDAADCLLQRPVREPWSLV